MAKSYRRFSNKRGTKKPETDPSLPVLDSEKSDALWLKLQDQQDMPSIEDFFEGPKNY
ncbi:hypothetical protein [Dyadobacter sp. CY312]|uniref:hypothetical protein n=1 Tax=Dyadobacter sp. CY312 TaxID=2907303 RepID=UPI001F28F666|nr:hypothetical protein [Dyadobacter sp. CY312]MCE7039228.1 hypothetical protein [Dyadobacter sp. CY312]